jgi:serine/threonine-protein kinase
VTGDKVDRRADVFALGVVLYQLATGKHPFRAENEFATMARIRDKEPAASPCTLVPDLPPALEAVMLKVVAKQRDDRYADMLELRRALEQALPSPPDVERALGEFMRTLLSQRAARRQEAIRRAVQALSERPRPVDQGPKPPFPYVEGLPDLAGGRLPRTGSAGAPPRTGSAGAPPRTGSPIGAPPTTGPQGASQDSGGRPSSPVDLPEGMRPRRSQTTLVVAGIVLVLVLVLAVLAAATASSGSGDTTTTTKRAF